MVKKIILSVVSTICVASLVVGCGANNKKVEKEISGDEKFIIEASKAINKRWDSQEKGEKENYTTEQYIKILEDENKSLEAAKETIENKEMLKEVESYIEGNKKQIAGSKTQDEELSYKYSEESEKLRKPALINLVDKYGMTINENNKQIYTDFKAKASIINKETEGKEFAEKLATEIEFSKGQEYGIIKYEAVVENTSDFDFQSISYIVDFLDSDGVVVDSDTLYVDNFNKGTKKKVEVSTTKKHEKVNVTLEDQYTK